MPKAEATSRWVSGRAPPRPYRRRMISASRAERQVLTSERSRRALSRSYRSSSIVSSTPTTSSSCRASPSRSLSMESDRETSFCSFFWLRKYIRISFAIPT